MFNEIREQLLSDLYRKKILTVNSSGSVLDQLVNAIALQIERLEAEGRRNLQSSRLNTAQGGQLDEWGDFLFEARLVERKANSLYREMNVYVQTQNGETWETAYGGFPPIIGKTIFDRTNTKRFIIREIDPTTTLNSNIAFVSVEAVTPGSTNNLGEGDLRGFEESVNGLIVSNRYSISNGAEIESDERYLARLLNKFRGFRSFTEIGIQSSLNRFSNIGKVSIVNNSKGICSTSIYVQPVTGITLTPFQLDEIEREVRRNIPSGHSVEVLNANQVIVSLETRVTTTVPITVTEKEILKRSIKANILRLFSDLRIGEFIELESIASEILGTDRRIKSIGSSEGTLDKLTMSIFEGDFTYTETVTEDIEVNENEIIILDPSSLNIEIV